MKITIEFDDRLKPVLAKMLNPAFNKARNPNAARMSATECRDYMEAYSILTALDIELNCGKEPEATIKPLER